jgi:hypothetical protein
MFDREIRPLTGEKVLNVFDFVDMLAGRSYIVYYCGSVTGTPAYILRDHVFASNDQYVVHTDGTFTYDFDCAVENSATIQGTALVQHHYGESGAGGDRNIPTFTLQRIRNGVATTIGTVTLPDVNTGEATYTGSINCARTKLIPGDTLRLHLSIEALDSGGVVCRNWFDPDGSYPLKLWVPFRLDI